MVNSSLLTVNSKRGFTLIELLVAIAIIGVLFGVVITSAGAIQRQARDSQRKSDLRNIQSALQQYYSDANSYPLTLTAPLTFGSGTGTKTYLNKLPTDPRDSSAYKYCPYASSVLGSCTGTNCNYYALCAKTEGTSSDAVACITTCDSTMTYQVNPL